VTESDVRIVVHVHNDVFITFVHGISVYPKPHRFGQIHTEPGSWRYRGRDYPLLSTPRTDPGGRDSRTGLPPWVFGGKAFAWPRLKNVRLW
jgi:hypothetical protein